MKFKFPRMTFISMSVLSLSVLSGCSNLSDTPQAKGNKADPYDSYYGSEKNQQKNVTYSPKLIRTSTNGRSPFKKSAPRRYTVKVGDTLWGISNKFLKNPAYWPEIWDVNQKVMNPHRIYPGDVLYIYEGGKRKFIQNGSIVEKLVPQLRIERTGGGKPISTLKPFLVWPRVLDKNTIAKAPYIVKGRDSHLLIEENQTVYIKNLADQQPGGRYAIFHTGKVLKDPESGRVFGNEVVYSGFLEVERPARNADIATATVSESSREIRPGDQLLYIKDETHLLNAPIQKPKRKIRGTVISLFDAEIISAQTQVIAINLGARDGIKEGYTLGVYSPSQTVDDPNQKTTPKYFWDPVTSVKVELPPGRSGTAIVYKVLDDMSYALIHNSTHEVRKGYKIGNP